MVFKDCPVTHKNYFIEVLEPLKLKNIATAQSETNFLNCSSNGESSTTQEFPILKKIVQCKI